MRLHVRKDIFDKDVPAALLEIHSERCLVQEGVLHQRWRILLLLPGRPAE
jgi:hypothetical protein